MKRAYESTDLVAQATALLVQASVPTALRTDDAVTHELAADEAPDTLAVDLLGWRSAFAAAATPTARLDPDQVR